MTADINPISESALQFFGKVTASISHEINNVLAIINENAGLLEDYILMADKGMATDPRKFKRLAEKINAQIRRADTIVGNMNRFAHSVDTSIKHMDLGDLLGLVLAVAERTVSMRGIKLDLAQPANPVSITTHEFLLENLLWKCLEFSMEAAGHEKTIFLNVAEKEGKILIRFSRLSDMKTAFETGQSLETIKHGLLEALKGDLVIDLEAGAFDILLPHDIHG